MKPICYHPFLFGLAAATALPAMATVIKPVAATSSIAGDASSSVNYLLNDNAAFVSASLQDTAGGAATLDTGDMLSKAVATCGYRSTTGQNESWTRQTAQGKPVFIFDLSGGGDVAAGSILLWQYGNNGGPGTANYGNSTRGFSVIFHTEAEGNVFDFATETIELTGTMNGIPGDNTLDNKAQVFFGGITHTARYAALRIDSNFFGQNGVTGGDRYGLGEVRFASEATRDPLCVPPANYSGTSAGGALSINLPVTNNGTVGDLHITAAAIGGTDAPYFTFTGTLPVVVAPGATVNLPVSFDPAGASGIFNASLDLTTDDAFLTQHSVALQASVAVPDISVPAVSDFGPVANGALAQTFALPVSNTGTGPLSLFDAYFVPTAMTAALSGRFTAVHDFTGAGPITVAAAGQSNLQFSFDPTGLKGGIYYATFRIVSDDPQTATTNVTVRVDVATAGGAPLVAWWPMETNSNDVSGNGFNGTDTGTITYAVAGANAATGKAADFSGNGGVHVTFNEALNPASYTLTAWASADTLTGNGSVVTSRNDSIAVDGNNYGYILYRNPTGWSFWTGRGSPNSGSWDTTTPVAAAVGQWVHLAIVYDHATHTKTLYVDGAVAATTTEATAGRNLLENFHIGSGSDAGNGFYFDGKIDDVALFAGVLDAAAINTIRTSGVTGFTGLPQPSSDPFAITGFSLSGGNLVIGSASGLTAGQQYHLETGVNLDDFAALPGSTFLGGAPVPQVPAEGPRRFVRIVDGPAPAP